jgi:hypothetical protein
VHLLLLLPLVTAALLLPGCGCGESVTGSAATQTIGHVAALAAEPSRDGWAAPGTAHVAAAESAPAGTGDDAGPEGARRQFLSFGLSTLPAGAVVEDALLRVFQVAVDGTPYATHGVLLVDHLVYDALDPSDYDRTPLTAALGTLSTSSALEIKRLDVTAALRADLAAGRARTQLRLRWSALDQDGDAVADQARFVDAEDLLATGLAPRIVVTYSLP